MHLPASTALSLRQSQVSSQGYPEMHYNVKVKQYACLLLIHRLLHDLCRLFQAKFGIVANRRKEVATLDPDRTSPPYSKLSTVHTVFSLGQPNIYHRGVVTCVVTTPPHYSHTGLLHPTGEMMSTAVVLSSRDCYCYCYFCCVTWFTFVADKQIITNDR